MWNKYVPLYRREVNRNVGFRNRLRSIWRRLIVTNATLRYLYVLTEQLNKLSTVSEEHTTQTNAWHLFYADDLKLRVETQEELQKADLEPSLVISIWNSDLPSAQICYERKKTNWLTELSASFKERDERALTGEVRKCLGTEESEGIQH
jgi:hypothetical protein